MARRGVSGDHGATTGNGRLTASPNGYLGGNGERGALASGHGSAPRVTRRKTERRLAALAAAVSREDGRKWLRRLAVAIGDPGRHGRRLEACLAKCVAHAEASTGIDRWLMTEGVAWGIAVATRLRRSHDPREYPLHAAFEEAVGPARDALAGGDVGAARCLLVAGTLLADVDAVRRLGDQARAAIEADIARSTGDDGALLAGHGPSGSARVARVASWADTRAAVDACGGQAAWNRATETRFRSACRTALALLGPQARCPGPDGRTGPALESLVAAVAGQGRRARATVHRIQRGTKAGEERQAGRLLPRELTLADGCQAVIRSGWEADDLHVFVDWQRETPWLEVAVGRRLLVSGPWPLDVAIDGVAVAADGPWRFSSCAPCRHGTFLEIARSLAGGGELQRQVVVLAADRVVLFGDAVVIPGAEGALTAESRLSIAPTFSAAGNDETRERLLADGKPRAALLPLALPEWTVAPAPGELAVVVGSADSGSVLRLRHAGSGGRLYAPLWIEGDRRRAAGPVTWRQLTVADTRRILGRHEAVGYRVQAGVEQWLVYRALDEPRNRTLLGCNVSCELVVGRIKPRGRVGRSIEIE
ncbi:MAG: hypothetical protein ACKO9B_09295 [Planctomycetota bacterium]